MKKLVPHSEHSLSGLKKKTNHSMVYTARFAICSEICTNT